MEEKEKEYEYWALGSLGPCISKWQMQNMGGEWTKSLSLNKILHSFVLMPITIK